MLPVARGDLSRRLELEGATVQLQVGLTQKLRLDLDQSFRLRSERGCLHSPCLMYDTQSERSCCELLRPLTGVRFPRSLEPHDLQQQQEAGEKREREDG